MSSVLKAEHDAPPRFLLDAPEEEPVPTLHDHELQAASEPNRGPYAPTQDEDRAPKRSRHENRATRAHFYTLITRDILLPGDELHVPLARPVVQPNGVTAEVPDTGVFTVSLLSPSLFLWRC